MRSDQPSPPHPHRPAAIRCQSSRPDRTLTARNAKDHKALVCLNRLTAALMRLTSFRSGPGLVTAFAVIVLATAFFDSSRAYADLRLCNRTQNRVGVSIGYKDKKVWTTEGWWNVPMNSCETLVSGTLVSRYYYIYAVDYDHGGEWSGKYAMCTKDKMFTIQGTEDCVARGFNRSGFFEVDTGEQSTWTIQLNEPTQQGAKNP